MRQDPERSRQGAGEVQFLCAHQRNVDDPQLSRRRYSTGGPGATVSVSAIDRHKRPRAKHEIQTGRETARSDAWELSRVVLEATVLVEALTGYASRPS